MAHTDHNLLSYTQLANPIPAPDATPLITNNTKGNQSYCSLCPVYRVRNKRRQGSPIRQDNRRNYASHDPTEDHSPDELVEIGHSQA